MASNRWGEDVDEELNAKKAEFKPSFTLNFKSMVTLVDKIADEVTEYDNKHPKDWLLKYWAGAMGMIFILFCLSYNILILATLMFFGFYGYVIINISKAYKVFGYNRTVYWLMTVGTLIAEFAISLLVKKMIFG